MRNANNTGNNNNDNKIKEDVDKNLIPLKQ